MKCTYGEHPWHTRIGNLNIFDSRYFGCTAALDAEHYLQEIGALEGFYFPRIMEVNPSPVTPPAETLPSVQISVEHPNLATSIQYGVSSLPVRDEVRTGGFVTDNWINFLFDNLLRSWQPFYCLMDSDMDVSFSRRVLLLRCSSRTYFFYLTMLAHLSVAIDRISCI
ncbi:uncharacterized protein LOC114077870 isoform X3 [Solanum pennellii]|uniref:Uncharacterized protein LOC114077870 isoform X3 n=1 Tax=Solanum pennellii TaxID=28526 RepID=A0ABM1VE67_SOLPN|nr:uncharacterized protein LOC114077870 isoform X3 [Solanum pennellii]